MRKLFRIIVDYSKCLAEMIQFSNYDWATGDIAQDHFPVKGKGKVKLNIELVHYNIHYGKSIESDDTVQDMERRGLRSATLPELLGFGSAYPDKQREFRKVALGSVWRYRFGRRYVACLCSFGSGRKLGLSSCRFAAVRK